MRSVHAMQASRGNSLNFDALQVHQNDGRRDQNAESTEREVSGRSGNGILSLETGSPSSLSPACPDTPFFSANSAFSAFRLPPFPWFLPDHPGNSRTEHHCRGERREVGASRSFSGCRSPGTASGSSKMSQHLNPLPHPMPEARLPEVIFVDQSASLSGCIDMRHTPLPTLIP